MPSPVKQAAIDLGIPVIESDPSEPTFLDELAVTGAEAAAVVAYGRILKPRVLEALPLGWYNLHFSLLPQWRGAAPVQRSIWSGDSITGATVFQITEGMDEGPILAPADIEDSRTPQALSAGELKIGKNNVWVGTATEALELLEVKAQGKKAMRAADWARGARLPESAVLR